MIFLLITHNSSLTFGQKHSKQSAITRLIRLFLILHIFLFSTILLGQQYSPTEIIVKFKQPVQLSPQTALRKTLTGLTSVDALNNQFSVQNIKSVFSESEKQSISPVWQELQLDNIYTLTLSNSTNLDEAIKLYSENPNILYAQPNHVYKVDFQLDDTLITSQWALERIDAFNAWNITSGSRDVIIAIIDTGIDYDHEDLASNIWINPLEDLVRDGVADSNDYNGIDDDGNGFIDDVQGWDFTDAPYFVDGGDYLTRDNDPADEHGHGTSVAGITAAVGDNGTGIAGLAFGCRVMNLRAGTSRGLLEEDDVASALAYAADNGARVVNMSFGDIISSPLFRDAVSYAHSRGLLLVASAGNSSSAEVHYPSGFDYTISVGSTDSTDFLSGFSNFGTTVDLVAPGTSILSTLMDDKYGRVGGTSAAAPFVSALSALIYSIHPDYSSENVQGILLSSTDDLGSIGWDRYYAAGRINAYRALQTNNYTIARILYPRLDQGFSSGTVPIIGTASGVYMESYSLLYGVGVDPEDWQQISQITNRQVIEDTLGYWNVEAMADTVYTLRLSIENIDGAIINQSVCVYIDRTPPNVLEVVQTPIIENDEYAILFEFSTDDVCLSSLYYRQLGSLDDYNELPLSYETKNQSILLTASMIPLESEIQIWLKNRSEMVTIENNGNNNYLITFENKSISTMDLVEVPYSIESAYLLNKPSDFNKNNNLEFTANQYTQDNKLASLVVFEFNNQAFQEIFSSDEPAIPRDIGDSDGDGLLEILTGYGAESMILEQNSPEAISFHTSWRNTDNFWAAKFADLDSDGRTEIIARIDAMFQIWENESDNQFVFIDSLPNPTSGINITGVPHVETGDFDGDGNQEIIFGDYDGDIYIYENIADNQMAVTWTDNLPLMDTIDFLSCGDYDGDGIKEFVVGCHSDRFFNHI